MRLNDKLKQNLVDPKNFGETFYIIWDRGNGVMGDKFILGEQPISDEIIDNLISYYPSFYNK